MKGLAAWPAQDRAGQQFQGNLQEYSPIILSSGDLPFAASVLLKTGARTLNGV